MTPPEEILVAALRSGRYIKGMHCLEANGCNCALGVGVREYMQLFPGTLTEETTESYPHLGNNVKVFRGKGDWEPMLAGLPRVVQKWLGWKSCVGTLNESGSTLARQNDRGETFSQIADRIERGEVIHG